MVKIQKISEIEPRLGFTEFDMLKKYRQSFATSELGRLHALFPFSELARQMHLKSSALGRKSYFSPEGKIALMVLKSYTNFSDAQLIEHLNGNIHYQLFCGVQIDPLHPLTNPKIVSAIRQELAHRLDVEPLQLILAEHWKPYLENLHVCMTDATCYESHLRFPTDTKLLWEGIVWLHRHLCKHCQTLHIQRPRNKYLDVRRAYLAYSKLRKRRKSQTRMITRRLLQLLEKLLDQLELLHSSYRNRLTLSSDYQRRFSVIQTVLEQGKNLFAGKKVSNRIVSIDRHYLRPIIRGKETKSVEFGAKVNNIHPCRASHAQSLFQSRLNQLMCPLLFLHAPYALKAAVAVNVRRNGDQPPSQVPAVHANAVAVKRPQRPAAARRRAGKRYVTLLALRQQRAQGALPDDRNALPGEGIGEQIAAVVQQSERDGLPAACEPYAQQLPAVVPRSAAKNGREQ